MTADGNNRHNRNAGVDRRPEIAGAPVEVDGVLRQRRPVHVVIAAREDDDHRARSQRFVGLLMAGGG